MIIRGHVPFLLLAVTCLGVWFVLDGSARGVSSEPSDSVFLLLTVTRDASGYDIGISRGAAFFIAPNGAAITNASVVYHVLIDPSRYRLVAVVGGESYSATIVCASLPPYDPAEPHPFGVPWSRDLAEIALTELSPATTRVELRGGPVLSLPPAHRGSLPVFSPLTLGPDPVKSDTVHVIWVDRVQPLPATAQRNGMVETTSAVSPFLQSGDFTPIFSVALSSQAVPGNSGAPVLNDRNQVVGVWTWYSLRNASTGIAISSSALSPVCL